MERAAAERRTSQMEREKPGGKGTQEKEEVSPIRKDPEHHGHPFD